MSTELFNPFEDRQSRDLRNDLSEGLAKAVETGNTDELLRVATSYRQMALAAHYRDYLEDRCTRYTQALSIIHGSSITDPIRQGLVLWNLGLFFEVHEILEHAWYSAEGAMKATLQALIRAAGVYIKREYGLDEAAARIADKAIPVIEANRALLQHYFPPEKLATALRDPQAPPPILG